MEKHPVRALAAILVLLQALPAHAEDAFDIFEEEAKVVTASQRPMSAATAPATVRVVTSEDIKARGARTIWDALRAVPGVGVMQSRAGQAEVGIRGVNSPLNNRVLVLLDGKTALNGMFDYITWETLPVAIEEIDRIEVVEGPASALYGANAICGVINIITKKPEQLSGGQVSVSAGEGNYREASAMAGSRRKRFDYKISTAARVLNRFENARVPATQSEKVHGQAGWALSPDERVDLRAGASVLKTQGTAGSVGTVIESGVASFLRADWRREDTSVTAFWNKERAILREFAALNDPSLDHDTVDLNVRRYVSLPYSNDLTVGAGYRRNTARSQVLGPGLLSQDLWSLLFEDEWRPADGWIVVASGRVDRHPHTSLSFSPRGSVVWSPVAEHTLRFWVGTSFRNPTMLENYLQFNQTSPNPGGGALTNPPFTALNVTSFGRQDLRPERMLQAELSHMGRFGPVSTTLTGWYYKLNDLIGDTDPTLLSAVPPTARLSTTYRNRGGTTARGLEAAVEGRVNRALSAFANWSYQSLRDDDSAQTTAAAAPRHKLNGGATLRRGGLTASLWGNWVDRTLWNENPSGAAIVYAGVADYVLLHGRVAYAFAGSWQGLELGLNAFNMLDRRHYELLPAVSAAKPGQGGEIIRSRWSATASYRF